MLHNRNETVCLKEKYRLTGVVMADGPTSIRLAGAGLQAGLEALLYKFCKKVRE